MLFKQSWTSNNNLVLKVKGEIKQKKKSTQQISFKLGGEQSGEAVPIHPSSLWKVEARGGRVGGPTSKMPKFPKATAIKTTHLNTGYI